MTRDGRDQYFLVWLVGSGKQEEGTGLVVPAYPLVPDLSPVSQAALKGSLRKAAGHVCSQPPNPLFLHTSFESVLCVFVSCTQLSQPHEWERLRIALTEASNTLGFVIAGSWGITVVASQPSPSPHSVHWL